MTQDEKILEQVRADIVEEQARLSDIQNEITNRIASAEKAVEEKLTARMVQLEHNYQKKDEELIKKQKYLDDYMVRIDAKDMEASAKVVTVAKREEAVKETSDKLALDMAKFNTTLNDADNLREKQLQELSARAGAQIEKDKAQDLREKNLDDREASFEATSKSLDSKISESNAILAKNEGILAQINAKKSSIDAETQSIKESLDAIEKEKQNLIQLSAIKDDIQKFEDEKAKFEKEKADVIQLSKNVEMRDKKVTEREITATEKEKYLILRDKEVQAKLDTLKKIRESNA